MTIKIPDIIEGQNPAVLGSFGVHQGAPSGLDGWTQREKEILQTTIHQEVHAIATGTSEDLSSLIPDSIPLYIKPKNVGPSHATMSGYQTVSSQRNTDNNGVLREKVIHKSPAALYAMALGIERSDIPQIDKFRMGIRHELIHTFTMNAVEIYEMLTEGVVEYLTETGVANSTRFAGNWNVQRFQGTCGLRSDDNSQIIIMGQPQQKKDVHDLTRIMAMNAFRLTTKDKVWALCKSLDSHTKEGGIYPTFQVLQDQIHMHLEAGAAEELLRQPLFQPMQAGEQAFLLPQNKPVKQILAQSVYVYRNPKYQTVNPATDTSEYRQFILEHSPTLINYNIKTRKGAGGNMTANHNFPVEIQQKQMAALLKTQGINVPSNEIASIDCEVRGLRETIRS